MAQDLETLLRRAGERDARLRFLEERLAALEAEAASLARQLRGNGAAGLQAELELCRERIEALRSQWKWIVGVLTTVAVAVAQACLRR
ncbi:MAG: hypothetical protein HY721_22205 [Planctomycetes bacterium]|nr:hypothetical protein [Planctomycetota bacterium]